MTTEEAIASLKEAVERVDNTIYLDAQEHARVVAERDAAKRELSAVKAKVVSAVSEYVELADRGIIRDSIIRDLLKQLKTGELK